MKSQSEIITEICVIGGSPGRHFEVPLWSVGDDKKMTSQACSSSVLCRNGVDVERFRACRIAFSPNVNGDKCLFSSGECYRYCGRPLVSLRSQNIRQMR